MNTESREEEHTEDTENTLSCRVEPPSKRALMDRTQESAGQGTRGVRM